MSFNPTRARRTALAVAAAGLLLTTAACGSSDDSSSNAGSGDTKAATGPVTFIVQSLANLNNGAGQGNRVTITFS